MTERTTHRDDRAIDLALGLLSADEESAALEEIAPDHEAESDLVAVVAHRESLHESKPPVLSAGGTGRANDGNGRKQARRRSPFLLVASLAAAATIVFVLTGPFAPDASDYAIDPIPVPAEMTRLRGTQDAGETLSRALDAYRAGSFEEAAALLGDARAVGATEVVRLVYLASAYNQTGRHDEAIAILESMPFETIPDPWGVEALNNLIHALHETGRDARAAEIAEQYGIAGETAR